MGTSGTQLADGAGDTAEVGVFQFRGQRIVNATIRSLLSAQNLDTASDVLVVGETGSDYDSLSESKLSWSMPEKCCLTQDLAPSCAWREVFQTNASQQFKRLPQYHVARLPMDLDALLGVKLLENFPWRVVKRAYVYMLDVCTGHRVGQWI